MDLTNRQLRRAYALAKQIADAGHKVPCNCGLSGCFARVTRKTVAQKIIQGQAKTLKLNDVIIRHALSMVSLTD
jgi:hypothetical protein